jgi:predicted phage tail protein
MGEPLLKAAGVQGAVREGEVRPDAGEARAAIVPMLAAAGLGTALWAAIIGLIMWLSEFSITTGWIAAILGAIFAMLSLGLSIVGSGSGRRIG